MAQIILETDKPVALNSPDHVRPLGTKNDNSRNPIFNKKLYALFSFRPLSICDLGCAGGAFVKECVDDGHLAIGLEGSDYSKKNQRAEWCTIPDNLLTCDVTEQFTIKRVGKEIGDHSCVKFDVVTAWELMEHIAIHDLPGIVNNVLRHLKENGIWILSIADFEDEEEGVKYHQTVKDKEWWERFFNSYGLVNCPELVDFFGHDLIRGPYQGSRSFAFILSRQEDTAPTPSGLVPYGREDLFEAGQMFLREGIEGGNSGGASGKVNYARILFSRALEFGEDKSCNIKDSLIEATQYLEAHGVIDSLDFSGGASVKKTFPCEFQEGRPVASPINSEVSPPWVESSRTLMLNNLLFHSNSKQNALKKISIVTPAFNCGPFIRECIESVLAQNYSNVEHIIVDGASHDGTVEILQEYSHLKWISEPDSGEADALNKGLRMATGDIIGWLGGDDRYVGEHVFDWVATKAEELTCPYVLYGKGLFINEHGEAVRLHIPKIPINLSIVSRWFNGHGLFQPSMFYAKDLLDELGDFREDLPYGIDYEYWLRIAARGYAFHYVEHILGESREGGRADSKSVMAPFEERANEWTKIAAAYQSALTESEQINFWKDYYSYRIQAQPQYSERISYPEQKTELLGFAAALDLCNHLSGLREVFDRLVCRFPKYEDSYWLLASCLARNGEHGEAEEIRKQMAMMIPTCSDNECEVAFSGDMRGDKTSLPQIEDCGQNDSSGQPLVSVIIPTFNRPEQLVQAVQSVLSQTYSCIEIIAINDGGCDVESILSSLPGSEKILYLRIGENRERSHARNVALNLACGKYIAYLDDDDRFYPDHVSTLVSFLEKTGHQVAYTDAHRVTQVLEQGAYVTKNRDIPYSYDFNCDLLLRNNFIPILCLMHAKTCIDFVGNFDEELSTHEDWDFLIRLSRCFSIHHVKAVTGEFSWRTDGTSTSSQRSADFLRTRDIILRKYRSYWPSNGVGDIVVHKNQQLQVKEQKKNQKSYDCSIIIPVFNEVELTKQCLVNLAQVTTGIPYEVVVVDNHSTDGTSEFLNTLGGDVQILRNASNLGFAKACNQGARAARGKYLVFLNNDTIPKAGWLTPLVQEVDSHEDVGVVGSKLLYPDNTIQHAGVAISRPYRTPYHIFLRVPEDLPAVNNRKEFQAVTAACMLVRKENFGEVGGFDEGFVNGFEDVDLCFKIRQLGMKIIYQPQSCLYHLESQTPGRKTHDVANAKRLLTRWDRQWFVDEDLVAYQSGYVIQQIASEEKCHSRLIPINEVANSEMWKLIVELQQCLLGQPFQSLSQMAEKDKIHELLTDVERWPNDIGILEWVGSVCETLQCESEAQAFWLKLLTLGDHPNARIGLARIMLKHGKLVETQKHLEVLFRNFPPRAEGWLLQGILFMQWEKFSDAKQAFEQVLDIDFCHTKARIGLGMACLGLGQASDAWNVFEHVGSEHPDHAEALRGLIQAGTVLQRWDSLGEHLSRFIERNPADFNVRFALAGVLFRAGYLEKSQEHLTWLRLLQPDFEGLEDLERVLAIPQALSNIVSVR